MPPVRGAIITFCSYSSISICCSCVCSVFSWCRTYRLIISSFTPTVSTKYPRDQKWFPLIFSWCVENGCRAWLHYALSDAPSEWILRFWVERLRQDVHDLAEYLAQGPHNLLFRREYRSSYTVPCQAYLSGSWNGTLASTLCGICNANIHVMNSCKAPCRFVSFYLWWVSRDIPAWAFFRL